MTDQQLKNVSFDLVRYANCWEDADVLLEALDLNDSSNVMSIASAGDNCFSLLTANPQQLIAVDISEVQLYLCELKMAAINSLDRSSYMSFVGFNSASNRRDVYLSLREQLSASCRTYWNSLQDQIEGGVIHHGKFEQYFQLFRKDFLLPVHNQTIIDELIREKSAEEQLQFHDFVWHNAEYDKMYRYFFGEKMMGERGRDPEFLKHVEGKVEDLVMAQDIVHLKTKNAQRNYFLHYMVNNKFDPSFLPHYVREGNYEKVKANLHKMILHKGLLNSATEKHSDCTHFNLSDIFEYMDVSLFKSVTRQLLDRSASQARFAFWNLMVPRNMADIFPDEISFDQEFCDHLKKKDMGYFYRAFVLNSKL